VTKKKEQQPSEVSALVVTDYEAPLDFSKINWREYQEDSNHQYLRCMPHEIEEFILWDSWDVDTACRLITLGHKSRHYRFPDDAIAHYQQLAEMPITLNERGLDTIRGRVIVDVYFRARDMAQASVNAGTIKLHDKPANWIRWAKGKGYSVEHLAALNSQQKPSTTQTPLQRGPAQDVAILAAIKALGHTPSSLPERTPGKSGVKATVWGVVKAQRSTFASKKAFDIAWQRLRDNKDIGEGSD
jgi:hypothetical protein